MRPLAIELFCGSFGWSAGLLAAGWRTVGFDIEHLPHHGPVPEHAELVLQDVMTLDGSQFRKAELICASPPCQEFSFRAQPWKIARAKKPEVLPDWWKKAEGEMNPEELSEWRQWQRDHPADPPSRDLFDACFRIQREASEAAGRYIPLVVENVKGAQPWVGRAKANYGSYYLWGDVAMVGRRIVIPGRMHIHPLLSPARATGVKVSGMSWFGFGEPGYKAQAFNGTAEQRMRKNNGGSWFNVAHNTESGVGQNPVNGCKVPSDVGRRTDIGKGARFTTRDCGIEAGIKQGGDWFGKGEDCSISRRKAASAAIAKIPFDLAYLIGQAYYPEAAEEVA